MGLKLLSHTFGPIFLAAAPPGSGQSHVEFTLQSSGGPFCIVGFYIEPVSSDAAPAGSVQIGLSRINGSGVIHKEFEIAKDIGVGPKDLIVSYGSVISASFSVSFHATQFPSSTGTGKSFRLHGTVVFVADDDVTLTVSPGQP